MSAVDEDHIRVLAPGWLEAVTLGGTPPVSRTQLTSDFRPGGGRSPLVEAAHIIADSDPRGILAVSNGLARCRMHHAAYDRDNFGIRPDYVVQIDQRLLDEVDGPMLLHGLQDHHGRRIMQIPRQRGDRPDAARLEERWAGFLAA